MRNLKSPRLFASIFIASCFLVVFFAGDYKVYKSKIGKSGADQVKLKSSQIREIKSGKPGLMLGVDDLQYTDLARFSENIDVMDEAASEEKPRVVTSAIPYYPGFQSNRNLLIQICWHVAFHQSIVGYTVKPTQFQLQHIQDLTEICSKHEVLPRDLNLESFIDIQAMAEVVASLVRDEIWQIDQDLLLSDIDLASRIHSSDNIVRTAYLITVASKRGLIAPPSEYKFSFGPMAAGLYMPQVFIDVAMMLRCRSHMFCDGEHPMTVWRCLTSSFGCPDVTSIEEALFLVLSPMEYDLYMSLLNQVVALEVSAKG